MDILNLIEKHKDFPFLNANYNISDYVLINLYWLKYIQNYINQNQHWEFFDENYQNFDSFQEQSLDVLSIVNRNLKKALIINPIDYYFEKHTDKIFYIGIDREKKKFKDEYIEYQVLDIYIDLREEKAKEFFNFFLDYFINKNLGFEEIEDEIDSFETIQEKSLLRNKL